MTVGSLIIPGVAYVMVSLEWEQRRLSPVSGDEPHYLIIADAVIHDHSVDVRRAYDRDAVAKRIIGPTDWENHSRTGSTGTFSVHDIGLPILIAPAFARLGISGVRVMLGVIAGLVPFLLYTIARRHRLGDYEAVALAFGASLGLPLMAASGQ